MGSGKSTPEKLAEATRIIDDAMKLLGKTVLTAGEAMAIARRLTDKGIEKDVALVAAEAKVAVAAGGEGGALTNAYIGAAMRRHEKRGGSAGNTAAFAGGCGCGGGIRFGAMDTYKGSDTSAVKEGFIKEVLDMAKDDGAVLTGSTQSEQLVSYISSLKTPTAAGVEARCRKLATRINDLYGDVIDTTLGAKEICAKVAEVLASFRSGMHSEFLTIYNDVRMVIQNLATLEAWTGEQLKELKSSLDGANLPVAHKSAGQIALLENLHQELKRQLQLLAGLMQAGNLEQTAAGLARASARAGDISGQIEQLRKTSSNDSQISMLELNLRRGVAINAIMAEQIHKALELIGISVAEFKNADTLPKLRELIMSGLLKSNVDSVDAYAASKAILDRFDDHDRIVELIEKHGKGEKSGRGDGDTMYGGGDGDVMYGGTVASEDTFDNDYGRFDANGYPVSDIQRRQKAQDGLRDMVLQVFTRTINERFNAFVAALNALSQRVGKEVAPTESLRDFIELLGRVSNNLLYKKYVYYALIGYYNDAMSKSHKDEFVGNLNMLIRSIDGLLALPDYASGAQYLRDVKDSLTGVLSVIDKYSEEITAKFGSDEHKPVMVGGSFGSFSPSSVQTWPLFTTLFNPAALMMGAGEEQLGDPDNDSATIVSSRNVGERIDGFKGMGEEPVTGAYADGAMYGGTIEPMSVAYQPSRNITDAITAFTYNTRAALIRKNMEAVAAETTTYGKDQTDLNAKSIVEILSKRQNEYVAMREYLKNTAVPGLPTKDDDDKARQAAQEILDDQWAARRGFWAVIESMDQCMRTFTDSMLTSPTSIKDIDTILADIEVIADWPGKDTGKMMADIFEHFPISAITGATTVPTDSPVDVASASGHYYDALVGKNAVGNPFILQTPTKGEKAYNKAKTLLMRMTALKNLFSVFIHFGRSVGRDGMAKNDMMSPANMYRGVLNYLRASAFAQGFKDNAEKFMKDDKTLDDSFKTATGPAVNLVMTPVRSVATGVAGSPVGGNPANKFRRQYGIRMRGVADAFKDTELMDFTLEDQYFVHMIKAAAAKILTVTGTYALFSRPVDIDQQSRRLSPIRMILGGGIDTPEIIPEATALYLRLPLLVHWYRRLFDDDDPNKFDNYNSIPVSKGSDKLKISYVPDIDGTFASLIKLIFREMRAVDPAAYTDEDVRKIVREVNLIYQRSASKHTGNVIRGTIMDLVNEINRRYGIVAKKDYDLGFNKNSRGYEYSQISGQYNDPMDEPELAILPDEDKDLPQRLTPSQRMLADTSNPLNAKTRKSPYSLNPEHMKIVKHFRCAIDKLLEGDGEVYQFTKSIDSVTRELKTLAGADKRLEAVAKLMRGTDLRSRIDGMKYVMFNETVVAPLNVLSGIHTMLKRFQTRMVMCDYQRLAELIAPLALAAGNVDSVTLVPVVWTQFKLRYPWVEPSTENEELLKRVFGWDGINYNSVETGGIDRHQWLKPLLTVGGTALGAPEIVSLYKSKRPPTGKKTQWEHVHAYFRGLFDNKFVMREILESVAALSDGTNMSASISDNKLVVSHGGIEETIRNLFASAMYFLNLLRSSVDAKLIQRWVEKKSPGSFYWLQEQLMEKIIVGRDLQNPSSANTDYVSLDKITRGIAGTWDHLTDDHKSAATTGVAGVATGVDANATRVSYVDVFANAIFYNANDANSGLMGSTEANMGNSKAKLADFRTNTYEELIIGGPPDKKVFDTRFAARFKQLYTWGKEYTQNRSLLFDFNQIVAKYLQSFYDVNTRKIYNGLIDKFANGAFSQAVNDPISYAYPDCVPAIQVKFGATVNVPVSQVNTLAGDLNGQYIDALTDLINSTLKGKDPDHLRPGANSRQVGPFPAGLGAAGAPNAPAFAHEMVQDLKTNTPAWGIDRVNVNGELIDAVGTPLVDPMSNAWQSAFQRDPPVAGAVAPPPAMPAFACLNAALSANPFATNMGDSGSKDRLDRSRMLAVLILRARKIYDDGVTAGVPVPHGNLSSLLVDQLKKNSYSIPSEGRASTAKFTVTGDDIATMDDSAPENKSLSSGSADKSSIVFARDGPIGGTGITNAYDGLGGKTLPPNTRGPASLDEALRFGQRADPDADHVLFASLAVTLRTLVSSKAAGATTAHYLSDNVADLPHHMKERMRANLPAFKRLIEELVRRCELIRAVIARGVVDMSRAVTTVTTAGALVAPLNPWPYTLVARATDSGKNKGRFSGIIDAITRGCAVLLQSIEQTLREVSDDAKYMDTYTGFIRDYASQNGVAPFAPLSSVLALMKNADKQSDEVALFPVHTFGEANFKLMFATRGLLVGDAKQTMENVPAFADIVQQYNAVVGAQSAVDNSNAALFLERFTSAVRWLHSTKHARGLLTSYHCDGVYTDGSFINQTGNAGVLVRHDLHKPSTISGAVAAGHAYGHAGKWDVSLYARPVGVDTPHFAKSIADDIESTIRQTESSMREEKIDEFVDYLHSRTKGERPDIVVQNVLDLDIVPINVHALMREIPFASLLNYSYSFDRMIIGLFYGDSTQSEKNVKKIIEELCGKVDHTSIRSAKDMLVALLIDPYMPLHKDTMHHLKGMLRGTVPLDGMARPRFLSDELYGTAVFGEVYCEQKFYNELGPGAGHITAEQEKLETHIRIVSMYVAALIHRQRNGTATYPIAAVEATSRLADCKLLVGTVARYMLTNKVDHMTAAKEMGKFIKSQPARFNNVVTPMNADNLSLIVSWLVEWVDSWAADLGKSDVSFANPLAIPPDVVIAGLIGIDNIGAMNLWRAIDKSVNLPGHALVGDYSSHNVNELHYLSDVRKSNGDDDDLGGFGASVQPDNSNVVDQRQVKTADVTGLGVYLPLAGAIRFDTVLSRNLVFVVNLLRAMRLQLTRDVFYGKGSVRKAKSNIAPGFTELYGNNLTNY